MSKSTDSEDNPGTKVQLHNFSAVWPQASHLSSPSFIFFIWIGGYPQDTHTFQGESSIAALKASGDSLSMENSLTDSGKFSWKWAKCFHQIMAKFQWGRRRWQTEPLSVPSRPTSWHSDPALFLTHVPGEQFVIWGGGGCWLPTPISAWKCPPPPHVAPSHTATSEKPWVARGNTASVAAYCPTGLHLFIHSFIVCGREVSKQSCS